MRTRLDQPDDPQRLDHLDAHRADVGPVLVAGGQGLGGAKRVQRLPGDDGGERGPPPGVGIHRPPEVQDQVVGGEEQVVAALRPGRALVERDGPRSDELVREQLVGGSEGPCHEPSRLMAARSMNAPRAMGISSTPNGVQLSTPGHHRPSARSRTLTLAQS